MEQHERIRAAEADKLDLENEIHQLKDSISAKKAEGERELRKKERMEKEMLELKRTLDNRTYEIKQKQALIAQGEDQILRLEQMLKEQRSNTDKAQREYNHLNEKVQKLHRDLEEQIHTNTQLLAENSQKQVELKVKEDEIQSIKVIYSSSLQAQTLSPKPSTVHSPLPLPLTSEKHLRSSKPQPYPDGSAYGSSAFQGLVAI